VPRYAIPEKRMNRALAGSVIKLRGQDYIPRHIFLLQTAYGRHRDNPANVQRAERVDIGPMIYFVRQNPMATAVSRQKVNLTAA
jgi:hypothetical protein